eukprot:gene35167-58074_t
MMHASLNRPKRRINSAQHENHSGGNRVRGLGQRGLFVGGGQRRVVPRRQSRKAPLPGTGPTLFPFA